MIYKKTILAKQGSTIRLSTNVKIACNQRLSALNLTGLHVFYIQQGFLKIYKFLNQFTPFYNHTISLTFKI